MPCDRDFGRVEKQRRKENRIFVPSQWVSLIRNTDKRKPFKIYYVEHPLTDDMCEDGTLVIPVTDYKLALDAVIKPVKNISKLRGISMIRGKVPVGRFTMTGAATEKMLCLKKGMKIPNLVAVIEGSSKAYNDFLGIKPQKLKDVNDLLQHVSLPGSVTFYQNIKANETDEERNVERE